MIKDIYLSFRALPLWVQIWVTLSLVPINCATLLFLTYPYGPLVATLAIAGMAFNLIPMIRDRGFGKSMAIPHLIFWVPLVLILATLILPQPVARNYTLFLLALLTVDTISLLFDIPDAWKWLRGDRNPAR